MGNVSGEELGDVGAGEVDQRLRVLTEEVPVAGRERELVEIEGLTLLGDEVREGEAALVVQGPALQPDEGAVDELARLARARDELPIALGLALDLGGDAFAGAPDFLLEAPGLALSAVLAHDAPGGRRPRASRRNRMR